MNTRKKVVVNIFGSEYTIVGESPEDYIIYLAEKIDETMKEIGKRNSKYSTTMIAVLTALNMADFLYKAQEELSILTEENEKLKAESAIPLEELAELHKETDALKQQYMITQGDLTKAQIDLGVINNEYNNILKENRDIKVELDVSRSTMKEMQNKLFENQIELLKTKKELDELKALRHNRSNSNQNNTNS
ncbi:MAG: cell division protein ZapA [Lutispora sp.]|nr:cell division protein ZapA [Lutispora sp.]